MSLCMPWKYMEMYSSACFYISNGWMWMVSFRARPRDPKVRKPQYRFTGKLCDLQSRYGQSGEEKNHTWLCIGTHVYNLCIDITKYGRKKCNYECKIHYYFICERNSCVYVQNEINLTALTSTQLNIHTLYLWTNK